MLLGQQPSRLQLPATALPVVTAQYHAAPQCGVLYCKLASTSTAWWHPYLHLNTTGDGLKTIIQKEAGCCRHIPAVGGTTLLKQLPMQGQHGSNMVQPTWGFVRAGDARLTK